MGTVKPIKTIWAVRQQAETLDIYLYDYIKPDGVNWLTGEKEPSDTSANTVKEALQNAQNISAINLFVNSYGGDVKEGLAIYNLLQRHPAFKTGHNDGMACSIAGVILCACNKVIAGENTLFMIHAAQAGAYGTEDDLRNAADGLHTITAATAKSYLSKSQGKLDEKLLNSWIDPKSKDTWLTAEQCVQYGLADEIAGSDNAAAQTAAQQAAEARASFLAEMAAQNNPSDRVPEQFTHQKTNAERLMTAFKKKMEVQ